MYLDLWGIDVWRVVADDTGSLFGWVGISRVCPVAWKLKREKFLASVVLESS